MLGPEVDEADTVVVGEPPRVVEVPKWVVLAPEWVEATPEWLCGTGGQGMGRAFIASYRRPVSSILPLLPLDIIIHAHTQTCSHNIFFYQYCQITQLGTITFIIFLPFHNK